VSSSVAALKSCTEDQFAADRAFEKTDIDGLIEAFTAMLKRG
jgi:hypothetical protein